MEERKNGGNVVTKFRPRSVISQEHLIRLCHVRAPSLSQSLTLSISDSYVDFDLLTVCLIENRKHFLSLAVKAFSALLISQCLQSHQEVMEHFHKILDNTDGHVRPGNQIDVDSFISARNLEVQALLTEISKLLINRVTNKQYEMQ